MLNLFYYKFFAMVNSLPNAFFMLPLSVLNYSPLLNLSILKVLIPHYFKEKVMVV